MIGENLKELMKMQGVTQKELAESAGLSQGYVSYVLNDKRVPTVIVLEKLCKVLYINIGDLYVYGRVVCKSRMIAQNRGIR